jgi:signal transduction histidine kinase
VVSPQTDAEPEPGEAHILQILSHQLGIALANARLFDNLHQERNLLHSILANMLESVLVVEDTGRVLLANTAAARLLRIQDGSLLPAWFSEQIRAAPESAPQTELRRTMEVGSKTISVSVVSLANGSNMPASTIYTARDISQEAQVERLKSDFVAYVSHELRTPLTTIKMLLRLLFLDTPKDSKQHEYLSVISTQVDRQTRLVSNLLDFTRLEAGKYELTPEPVDPRNVVQSALSVCRPLAEDKGVMLNVAYGVVPASFTSNTGGLEQVLINLLSNAIKFTDKGGQVVITCGCEEQSLVLTVQDTGIGMTPDQLSHIFHKFYTVQNPRKRGEGTGLGLVISDMIVKELGGHITVNSTVGTGSRFSVWLPLNSH